MKIYACIKDYAMGYTNLINKGDFMIQQKNTHFFQSKYQPILGLYEISLAKNKDNFQLLNK